MTVFYSPVGNSQIEDANGNPLVGGKIYTYLAGSSTPAATYTSNTGLIPQSNPIILNSMGLPASPIWLTGGVALKFVIKDASDVTIIPTIDNITGINDSAVAVADQWITSGFIPTYIAPTIFSVPGDQTLILQVARRVKTTNTAGLAYSTIVAAAHAVGVTTVTLVNDSTPLDIGLSAMSYSFLSSTQSAIPAVPYTAPPPIWRNRIFNGDIAVDQRNSAAVQTITSGAALSYMVDRFYGYCTGANVTHQQITGADGRRRGRFTGLASNTSVGWGTRCEAKNTVDLAGSTATLSVKLSSSTLTTVNWATYYANTADTFGTLASPTRTAIASGSFTINATEATYSAQIAIPAGATTGIETVFTTGALLASAILTYGDVQLEKGAIANAEISFEVVDYGLQLSRCTRYFQLVAASLRALATGVSAIYGCSIGFASMRAMPSVGVPTGAAFTNISTSGFTALAANSGRFDVTASTAGDCYVYNASYPLSSEL